MNSFKRHFEISHELQSKKCKNHKPSHRKHWYKFLDPEIYSYAGEIVPKESLYIVYWQPTIQCFIGHSS
jgi:hypothetical protein